MTLYCPNCGQERLEDREYVDPWAPHLPPVTITHADSCPHMLDRFIATLREVGPSRIHEAWPDEGLG
jgi:hypothetical protein